MDKGGTDPRVFAVGLRMTTGGMQLQFWRRAGALYVR